MMERCSRDEDDDDVADEYFGFMEELKSGGGRRSCEEPAQAYVVRFTYVVKVCAHTGSIETSTLKLEIILVILYCQARSWRWLAVKPTYFGDNTEMTTSRVSWKIAKGHISSKSKGLCFCII